MKKIIFSAIAVMTGVAAMAQAPALSEFDGQYSTATATIQYYVPSPGTQNDTELTPEVKKTGDNSVTLSILNFSFLGVSIGDISVPMTAKWDDTYEGYKLTTPSAVKGPNVSLIGYVYIKVKSELESGLYKDGSNMLDLYLQIYKEEACENLVAEVTVSGATVTTSGVSEANAEKAVVVKRFNKNTGAVEIITENGTYNTLGAKVK